MTGPRIIAGLDIGTSKICVMVAEIKDGTANLLGFGGAVSAGVIKGNIVDAAAAADSIRDAVKEASTLAGLKIKSFYTGISGGHIKSFSSSGITGVRDREVGSLDIAYAIDSAKSMYVPLDREGLHVLPTEFILDGMTGISDPTGMPGVRLEVKANIITAAESYVQNLRKCCVRAGFDVNGIVLTPLVSAYSVLTKDEMESGALMIDIGGGTTEIVYFKNGFMKHFSVLKVGGTHITNDIAIGLRISVPEAEKLKKDSGAAIKGRDNGTGNIEIIQENGEKRSLPAKQLFEIIRPRCEEILEMLDREIKLSLGKELSACSVVLTGGAALLGGFDRLAEVMLGLPVRIGRPLKLRGLKNTAEGPAYSAAAGLVLYAERFASQRRSSNEIPDSVFKNVKERLSNAFR